MSELELIRDMCAAVPAPDADRLAAVRARVLDQALARPRHGARRRGPLRIPGRLGLGLAGTAAAVTAVIVAITGVISFGGSELAPPASAAVLLNRAAAAALAQPVPTDGQLIYSDTAVYYATYARPGSSKPAGHVIVRQQEWQSPASPSAFYRTSPCDVDGDLRPGRAACSFHGDYAPGAQAYRTYAGLRTLPASAGKLLSYLATLPGAGGLGLADRQWSGANLIAQLNPVLPPGFGAALFRAIAQIPGTSLLPAATDAAGAHGIGIAKTVAGMREELIFDPASYQLIGQQSAVPGHGGSAGYVASATALHQVRFTGTGPGPAAGGPAPGSGATPRDDQFIYTDTRILVLAPSPHAGRGPRFTAVRGSQQMWQSVDGSRPGAFRTGPCQPGASCLLLIAPGGETAALPSYAGLTALPRNPGALASYLQRNTTCPAAMPGPGAPVRISGAAREWDALTAIAGSDQVLPPGLGRAFFQTAAAIPGAAVLNDVTDAAGGRGIAVARNQSPSLRTELIFTPGSYRFIGIQEILTRPAAGLRAGTVWAASSLAGTQITNAAPAAPLSQSYTPQTCGYSPGSFGVTSSGSSVPAPSVSSGSSASEVARP